MKFPLEVIAKLRVRRFSGSFEPLFDFFRRGNIWKMILPLRKKSKSGSKEPENRRTLSFAITSLIFTLVLGGCMMGPNYHTPESAISDEWKGKMPNPDAAVSKEEPVIDWWNVFQDPLLSKYIELAALYNNNIQAAEANILQARAVRQVTASSLFPQVNLDLNGTKTFFSKNGPIFAMGSSNTGTATGTTSAATGLPFQVQTPQIQPLYTPLFDASWELDLFGKTRRAVESAQATLESIIEQRNDTLLSVLAEVARNYMELRGNQKRAELIKENIELLKQNAEIIALRLESGYANQLDLENIEADLASARSALPDIYAQIYRGIYTLSILTGNLPEALVDELLPQKPLPKAPPQIAVGLRSDLLRRRPDVRRSEKDLAAATANIGVAIASFFPTITLSADAGFQSLKLKNLFQMPSRTWAVGGDINIPIFQGGALVGNLRASRAAASAATYTYQQTVLNAIQDAESTLISYTQEVATSRELDAAAKRNQNLVDLSQQRYIKGLVNKINLLDSQRQLNAAQQSLVNSEITALVDLIALYKALGGGWQPMNEPAPESSSSSQPQEAETLRRPDVFE